jgi:hypothetical protein
LASHDAYNLAAVGHDWAYASFGGSRYGTWEDVNGGWDEIDPGVVPITMDASTDGELVASYAGNGTYSYDTGGWFQITTDPANAITVVDDYNVIGSYADGTYHGTDGSKGYEISPELATQLGHSGNTVIGSWGSGTYTYDAYTTNWQYVGSPSYQVA